MSGSPEAGAKVMVQSQKQKTSPFADFGRDKSKPDLKFQSASERVVRIDVEGRALIKLGSAIAYFGEIEFKRLPPLKMKGIQSKALSALTPLVSAEGKGVLYCATNGWRVNVVQLADQIVNVSAEELLVFEDSLEFEFFGVGKGISLASGGVIGVRLTGTGSFALAVHGAPLVLPVRSGDDLFTDPHATVAWTDGLQPTLETDLSWRSLLKIGGGEAFQMRFSGNGEVVIQPSEDKAKFSGKRIKSLL
jgi:uncharacterized protein (AIM24 family)